MKFKSLIMVVLVAFFSSICGGVFALKYLNNYSADNSSSSTSSIKVVETGSTKAQNVYQAVAEKASPSVVGIVSETVNQESIFSSSQVVQGSGTGFVVDKRGYILTNSHVVSDGQAKSVKVVIDKNKTVNGNVIWNDTSLDLAIVKVNTSGLTVAELGDSDSVKVGDIAIAIGNPLGTELMSSVTQGIVSGLNRDVSTSSSNMSGLIQTDASINPGNSGGPLLNQQGQVIGINTVKANADNLGFSIPINTAKNILQRVIEDNNYEKPLLGVTVIDIATYKSYTGKDLGVESGVIVKETVSGSIAKKAGIEAGDIIVKIGDKEIKNRGDISKKLYSYSKGSKDTVTIIRNGKEKTLNIEF
ncbi:S1C family serine protease [Peptostreptococcus porci]|uniref:S1C family serine protease n=1 Tax=Peptostreptococcus porci TaxID=2652282 RepID=UPI002A9116D1|nr:trypsin-like peptidase domain-containing protein [Peptostreptococcus porci]MDY5435354.1 trypsin-like peptidase domain-containing protein [Peptostreptococcus porci]MDY6231167.1 trypsin-like peptidase domain-containing protein [Peptostreptococcus porci]